MNMPGFGKGKRALVLAGGGITGFLYEVGILSAYDEWSGAPCSANDFDMYVGTSAGAVLCALLANGAAPWQIFKAIHGEFKADPFYFEPRNIIGVASGGALKLFGLFMRALLGTFGRALRAHRWPSGAGLLADFQEHHPPGFYSTEALETTLCAKFSALGYCHHFRHLTRALYVSGTDIDTGEHLVFGDGEFADLHICQAVAASCALPIFFRPVRIGDRDVVDGSISEVSPLSLTLAKGARDILFVNPLVPICNDRSSICLPFHDGQCARLADKGVGWIGEQALRLMRSHCAQAALESVRVTQEDTRLTYVEPSRNEIPMFMHNMMSFSAAKELLGYGLKTGRTFFCENPVASL